MKLSANDPQLTAYALGELTGASRAEMETALKNSPELQREVAAIRQAAENLRQELAAEPGLDLTTEQRKALMQMNQPENKKGLLTVLFGANRPAWQPALALGLAVAVVAAMIVMLQPPSAKNSGNLASATNTVKDVLTNASVVQHPTPTNQTGTMLAMVPLPLLLPAPTQKGTPEDLPAGPNIEPLKDKARPPFLAPAGVKNVALHKPVTGSIAAITGELELITDGNKEAFDDQVVEMKKGLQYVQVDLQDTYQVFAIVIWNDHRYIQAYRRVIIQIADDEAFTKNVRTLFNNDYENRAGFGVGTDKEYFETKEGRLIDAKGQAARYVRWYTNGSHLSALNNRTEIEVYALPMAPLPLKLPAPGGRS
jgi:hypothetical protein